MTLFRFNLTCAYFGSSSIFLFGDSSSRVSNFLSYNKGCVDISEDEGGKKSDDEAQLTQSPFCPFTLFSTASVMSSSRSVSRGGAMMLFHNDATKSRNEACFAGFRQLLPCGVPYGVVGCGRSRVRLRKPLTLPQEKRDAIGLSPVTLTSNSQSRQNHNLSSVTATLFDKCLVLDVYLDFGATRKQVLQSIWNAFVMEV